MIKSIEPEKSNVGRRVMDALGFFWLWLLLNTSMTALSIVLEIRKAGEPWENIIEWWITKIINHFGLTMLVPTLCVLGIAIYSLKKYR